MSPEERCTVITKEKLEKAFRGSVTVGERGQVVIPAEVREEMRIVAGDKLLVFCGPEGAMVALSKLSSLEMATQDIQQAIANVQSGETDADGAQDDD
jgi:AbrB family looped-hinge helix DNA binding protein